MTLSNGSLFAFPPDNAQGLRGAPAAQLREVEVTPDGIGLHWESLDADLAVAPLLAGQFGSRQWMAELGRAGGRVSSPAKARAARINGRKGGRPATAAARRSSTVKSTTRGRAGARGKSGKKSKPRG